MSDKNLDQAATGHRLPAKVPLRFPIDLTAVGRECLVLLEPAGAPSRSLSDTIFGHCVKKWTGTVHTYTNLGTQGGKERMEEASEGYATARRHRARS